MRRWWNLCLLGSGVRVWLGDLLAAGERKREHDIRGSGAGEDDDMGRRMEICGFNQCLETCSSKKNVEKLEEIDKIYTRTLQIMPS